MQREIGERIRSYRKTHRPPWTINHLAHEVNMDPGQLSRAERGLAGLSIETLANIATQFGITLAELIDPKSSDQADDHLASKDMVENVIEHVWNMLDRNKLDQLRKSEFNLIRHHIRSAVEEGIKRGQILAETEIEELLSRTRFDA
ncbi:MAG: helix-turn-helix transcriptional regulator [Halieaceae bacterium]|jgi:transcriptional regulator with XRE-family HTH domain|nr:helix-turn-helix transcriptional regulator [Halieaceae bacterium]